MLVINLSEDFQPYTGKEQGKNYNPESFIFSGGEPHFKINIEDLEDLLVEHDGTKSALITARLHNSEQVLKLGLLVDAIKRLHWFDNIHLFCPYFPGARQDREMVIGEPLSVKFYADYINGLGFSGVHLLDPHSDVTPALVNNCAVYDNHLFVEEIMNMVDVECLVSPDAGASKKVQGLAKFLGKGLPIIKCEKDRDVRTGKILGFDVYAEDLKGMNCLIVDDICDGGGTFLGLADELRKRGSGKIYLAVTHGIFSKGLTKLNKAFDGIFTTDSFPNVDDDEFSLKNDNQMYKVTQIPLLKCLTER
jgi:ribose-phosphate pyrophosphokinase